MRAVLQAEAHCNASSRSPSESFRFGHRCPVDDALGVYWMQKKRGEARARDDLCYRRSLYLVLYPPHLNMPTAVDDTEKSDSNSKCILIIATVAKKGSIVFVFAKAFPKNRFR